MVGSGRLRGFNRGAVRSYHCPRGVVPTGDQRKLEQPAFDRAVEQRRLACDLEVDQLRQPQVAGEEERCPAGEALLQRVAQQRIERRHLLLVGEAHAVRRIGEQDARAWPARRARAGRRTRRATKSPTCAPFRLLCVLPTAPGAKSLAKIVGTAGAARMRSRAACLMRCHAGSVEPSAASGSRTCASVPVRGSRRSAPPRRRIVPLPHIGSSKRVFRRPGRKRE